MSLKPNLGGYKRQRFYSDWSENDRFNNNVPYINELTRIGMRSSEVRHGISETKQNISHFTKKRPYSHLIN